MRVTAMPESPPGAEEGAGPAGSLIHYDVSLLLHFGRETPVGLVRVEHYMLEYLLRHMPERVVPVRFSAQAKVYLALTEQETALLHDIVLRRYQPSSGTGSGSPEGPEGDAGAEPRRPWSLRLAEMLDTTPVEVAERMSVTARRLLPVLPEHDRARRVATRALRGSVLTTLRGAHRLSHLARQRWLAMRGQEADMLSAMRARLAAPELAEPYAFPRGSVLLSVGNLWDYMDYRYLARLTREGGVRLVVVLYDVIAMRYPHTSPAPAHIYHRHWLEIGHVADRIVAISRDAAETYRRYVAEPNDLDPAISWAYLPNFLKERAEEIGETPVAELAGRSFVVYCSTIETRKNHQTLLLAWDRLRERLPPGRLPILVLVGKWGWGTESVRLLVERNWRLHDHLRVLDRVSDSELIWLYRNARFSVFPSIAEGFGLGAAESLSFGTPVVISSDAALQEAVEGLMPSLDPYDLPGWVAALERAILDESHLQALRDAAARYRGAGYEDFAHAMLEAISGGPSGGVRA